MSILSWNCRGMGGNAAVQDLLYLVGRYKPAIVFIMETKVSAARIQKLRWRLRLPNFLGADSNGRSGGLGLFWSNEVNVSLQSMSDKFFDLMVNFGGTQNANWRLTVLYGEPRTEYRPRTWNTLRTLKAQNPNVPWAVMGDFNEVLWPSEHLSNSSRNEINMQAFRTALDDCDLYDIGFTGFKFTWDNKREASENVKARLDRVVSNDGWRSLFPNATVYHVEDPKSDHLPLRVVLQPGQQTRQQVKSKFRYEIMWEKHPTFQEMFTQIWREVMALPETLTTTLHAASKELKRWERANFGSIKNQLRKLETKLACLRQRTPAHEVLEEKRRVEHEMMAIFEREEIMWRQRSRVAWLKEGD